MRFILGFIFFGFLFYAIWYFFPDAFAVLVSWATSVFDFVSTLWHKLIGQTLSSQATSTTFHDRIV